MPLQLFNANNSGGLSFLKVGNAGSFSATVATFIGDTTSTPTPSGSSTAAISGSSPFTGGGNSYGFLGTGNSSYLAYPGNSGFAVGTGDFTIEWFQYQTDTSSFPRIFSIGVYPSAPIAVSIEGGTFYVWTNGSANSFGSAGTYKNQWVHFAVVRRGTSLRVYKNGTQMGSTLTNSANITNSTSPVYVGVEAPNAVNTAFGGYITSFRWIKGLGVYTGTFTVPTSKLGQTAGTNPYGGSNTQAISAGQCVLLINP